MRSSPWRPPPAAGLLPTTDLAPLKKDSLQTAVMVVLMYMHNAVRLACSREATSSP